MDKDKIIKALECHRIEGDHILNCADCPYWYDDDCAETLNADILALLKEQEERIKMLDHQLETITRWRANAGAFD